MSPRGSRRNICPQKHEQDSRDEIARRPRDVRRPRPALPLLRLQDCVVHDAPLLLLNGMTPRLCRQTRAMSLGQILIVLNRWDAPPMVWLIQPLEITHIQWLPSFALGENAANGCDQPIKFDRFGVKLITSSRERLFAFTGERMRGESDNGNVASLRIALEPPCGFPAVNDRHFEVHQDDIGTLGSCHLAALLPILRR